MFLIWCSTSSWKWTGILLGGTRAGGSTVLMWWVAALVTPRWMESRSLNSLTTVLKHGLTCARASMVHSSTTLVFGLVISVTLQAWSLFLTCLTHILSRLTWPSSIIWLCVLFGGGGTVTRVVRKSSSSPCCCIRSSRPGSHLESGDKSHLNRVIVIDWMHTWYIY